MSNPTEDSSKTVRKGMREISISSAPRSTTSSDMTVTSSEEREAAEVLLGLRLATQMEPQPMRKSVITDARTFVSNIPNIPSKNDTASSTNMNTRPPISIVPSTSVPKHSFSSDGGTLDFVPVQQQKNTHDMMHPKGSFLAPAAHQSSVNLSGIDRTYSVISIHPVTTTGTRGEILSANNVPISVVKRQDTISGRKIQQPPNTTAIGRIYQAMQEGKEVALLPDTKSSDDCSSPVPKSQLGTASARLVRDISDDPSFSPCILSSSDHKFSKSLTAAAGSASKQQQIPIPILPQPVNFQRRYESTAELPKIIQSRPAPQIHHERPVANVAITQSQNFDSNSAEGIYRFLNPSSNINRSNFYIPAGFPASGATAFLQLSPTGPIPISSVIGPSPISINGHQHQHQQNQFPRSDTEQMRASQDEKIRRRILRAKLPINRDAKKPITVDTFQIPREFWAKAFVQSDICHAAGILFKALFTPEEIQSCTLRGRNGTSLLDLQKRSAIFLAVGWMKNKNQNPYAFDTNKLKKSDYLTQEEKMIIEKKVFVERRYQTSRKIRDVPSHRKTLNANLNVGVTSGLLKSALTRTTISEKLQNPHLFSELSSKPQNQLDSVTEPQIVIKTEPMDVLELNQQADDFPPTTEESEKITIKIEPKDDDNDDQKQQEQMDVSEKELEIKEELESSKVDKNLQEKSTDAEISKEGSKNNTETN